MTSPIFHVNRLGNLANQMIQFLVACNVANRVPGCRISNVHLPTWQIDHPHLDLSGIVMPITAMQHVDVASVARLLRGAGIDCIHYTGYGQRLENFPTLEECRPLFRSELTDRAGFGEEHLVINIRGGEVLDGRHPGYTLVPIDFYAEIIRTTGLNPVFMGQIENNIYCNELRRRFPRAQFIASQGALHDFEMIRGSKNIIPSVSTFSWLAAWLSYADKVFMPLTGFYNPFQDRLVDLVPLNDDRFVFYLFPLNFSVRVDDYRQQHHAINGLWGRVEPARLKALLDEAKHVEKRKSAFVDLYDEDFYLRSYPEIATEVSSGRMPSGLYHYIMFGFAENRDPFALDSAWYTRTYPLAAMEIGRGEYIDVFHHYTAIGHKRGYDPIGPAVNARFAAVG